jgi:hypothetical protein
VPISQHALSSTIGTNFAEKRRSLGIVLSRIQATEFVLFCFEVVTAVVVNVAILWDIQQCSQCTNMYTYFIRVTKQPHR